MNLFFAVLLGLIFIYLVIRYFIQFYVNYSKKLDRYVKKEGYRSYSSYKKAETKKEKKRRRMKKKKLERREHGKRTKRK